MKVEARGEASVQGAAGGTSRARWRLSMSLKTFLFFSLRELEHLCVESPGPPPYILFSYHSDQLKPQPLAKYQAKAAP